MSDASQTVTALRRYADAPFSEMDAQRLSYSIQANPAAVYQVSSHERKKFRKLSSRPYSIMSASKYILLISLMLYWLPIIGQMIAGFVGGRRAGSPLKAIIAALLPLFVLFFISQALQDGIIPIKVQQGGVLLFIAIKAAIDRLPVASSYMNFATAYVGSFINELNAAASFKAGDYLITIAFAYIGGILSDQSRRELEYVSRFGAPTTNVVIPSPQPPIPQPYVEGIARPEARSRASWISSVLHPRPRANNSFSSLIPIRPVIHEGVAGQDVREMQRQLQNVRVQEPPRVRSWEDVYLSTRPATEMEDHVPPPKIRFTSRGPTAVPEDARARKFVERALGRDYLEQLSKEKKYRTYLVGGTYVQKNSRTPSSTEHASENWELL
jgi:hypothetical protein